MFPTFPSSLPHAEHNLTSGRGYRFAQSPSLHYEGGLSKSEGGMGMLPPAKGARFGSPRATKALGPTSWNAPPYYVQQIACLNRHRRRFVSGHTRSRGDQAFPISVPSSLSTDLCLMSPNPRSPRKQRNCPLLNAHAASAECHRRLTCDDQTYSATYGSRAHAL